MALTTEQMQEQIKELTMQNRLMKQLATADGFYQYWFSQLPKFRTRTECFNYVNDLYLDFFAEYKYSDYNSFKKVVRRKRK